MIMMKLNPYAKTARRHAILQHDPAVSSPRWSPPCRKAPQLVIHSGLSLLLFLSLDQGQDAEVKEGESKEDESKEVGSSKEEEDEEGSRGSSSSSRPCNGIKRRLYRLLGSRLLSNKTAVMNQMYSDSQVFNHKIWTQFHIYKVMSKCQKHIQSQKRKSREKNGLASLQMQSRDLINTFILAFQCCTQI